MWWDDEVKAAGERKMLGSKCYELEMKLQKEDVWKHIEKRRKRLKGVYIIAKRR